MLDNFGFHDASISSIHQIDECLSFFLEDVTCPDGSKACGRLELYGFKALEIDGVRTDDFDMEAPDGEVIDLQRIGCVLEAIIQWNDFERHTSVTRHYRVQFDSIHWIPDAITTGIKGDGGN